MGEASGSQSNTREKRFDHSAIYSIAIVVGSWLLPGVIPLLGGYSKESVVAYVLLQLAGFIIGTIYSIWSICTFKESEEWGRWLSALSLGLAVFLLLAVFNGRGVAGIADLNPGNRAWVASELPYEQLARLTGTCELYEALSDERVAVILYNGSDWRVSEIIVSLEVTMKNGKTLEQKYRLHSKEGIDSLSSDTLSAPVAFDTDQVSKWSWGIETATGYPR